MNSEVKKPTIGFVGLGKMGAGMAKNILKKGYPLLVWNRTPHKYNEHVQLGAKPASSPKALAEKADVIITMLSTPNATEQVIMGTGPWNEIGIIDGIQKGKVVVDMSTDLPSLVKRLAETIRGRGGEFIDAPVLGSVVPAAEGTLGIMPAGKPDVVERVKPILEAMGKSIWYVGDVGMGCAMKLTMNLHLSILNGAFAESLAFGAKAGLDPRLIVDIWNNSIFKTYITETKGEKAIRGDWTPAFTLELALKDTHLASEMAREVNAPIPLGSIVKQLYNAAVARGKKDLDYCALVTLYEHIGNVKVSSSK